MAGWSYLDHRLRARLFRLFSQVDPLLRRLRQRPKGPEVAEKLCMSLLDCHGNGGAARPRLSKDGSFLGMIGPNNPHRHHAIAHRTVAWI